MLKSSRGNRRGIRKWSTASVIRAAGLLLKSNNSRAMRGRIPKIPNFLAIRNQQQEASTVSQSKHPTTSSATTTATAKQPQRSSDRNRRTPSYYGLNSPSPDSTIAAPPKPPRRAGDVENYQPPPESIFETIQHIADQQPAEINISPKIGDVSPPAPQNPSLLDIDTPTLVHSMTVLRLKDIRLNNGLIRNWASI